MAIMKTGMSNQNVGGAPEYYLQDSEICRKEQGFWFGIAVYCVNPLLMREVIMSCALKSSQLGYVDS